jgi:O-antigen/teichoic acid export membrane protein
MAAETMPIVSLAVIFQILTNQYLHISFLLSNRNSFYLINTGLSVAFNLVAASLLTADFGAVGAAWARLAAEIFGFAVAVVLVRQAFPVPLHFARLGPVVIATMVMAIVVKAIGAMIVGTDQFVLVILVPLGGTVYLLIAVLANVAHARERLGRAAMVLRGRVAS